LFNIHKDVAEYVIAPFTIASIIMVVRAFQSRDTGRKVEIVQKAFIIL